MDATSIEIINITGNNVLSKTITSNQGIDISFLVSGIYFVKIKKQNETTISVRFIKK